MPSELSTSPSAPARTEVSRLAPSPTGALHLGNARTFLINWAIARQRGWRLLMRFEDLDTPRIKNPDESMARILDTLAFLGIDWDRWDALPSGVDCLVQSRDLEPYRAAMRSLASRGLAYPCQLTRSQIESAASAPQEGSHDAVFPASLRPPEAGRPHDFDALDSAADPDQRPNWRLLVEPGDTTFTDAFAGRRTFDVSRVVGDFVLWTRRGQPSYQLAVVVDDHRQGVTQVIRGDDLLDSAARQMRLYRLLGLTPAPSYTHLPLVRGTDGKRLAKRHGDTRVDTYRARGVPADAIIGLVGAWSGVVPARTPLTPRRFLEGFDPARLSPDPVTFTPEDDQWLLSQAPAR